jgi:hypothetical protein
MCIHTWIGLFDCGVDVFTGLGTLLQQALENLGSAARDVAISAIISAGTAIYMLYWLNVIAASFSQYSLGGYLLTLAVYAGSIGAAIGGFYLCQDAWLSKALLYGVGFTLLGLIIGAFWSDPQARIFPSVLRQQLIGGDPVMIGVKLIVNSLLATAMTASNLLAANVIFKNPLMWPFAIVTFLLALSAIYLGTRK